MTEKSGGSATEQKPAAKEAADVEKPSLKSAEENGKEPAKDIKDKAKGEPAEGSPRWNEIYRKSKEMERLLEAEKKRNDEREKDLETMRDHNKKLDAKMRELEESKADKGKDPEPDFDADPQGWRKWKEHQDHLSEQTRAKKAAVEHLQEQIEEQMDLHEDYDDVRKFMERAMVKDKALEKEIWDAANPALRMYIKGKKKMDLEKGEKNEKEKETEAKDEVDRKKRLEAADLEHGGTGEEDEKKELTKEQEHVVRMMYPDISFEKAKERYVKQLRIMEARR